MKRAAPEDWYRIQRMGDDVTLTENTFALDLLGVPVSFAFDGATYGKGTRTSAVVVLHKGQVVAEQYDRGIDRTTPQRTWSVATRRNDPASVVSTW